VSACGVFTARASWARNVNSPFRGRSLTLRVSTTWPTETTLGFEDRSVGILRRSVSLRRFEREFDHHSAPTLTATLVWVVVWNPGRMCELVTPDSDRVICTNHPVRVMSESEALVPSFVSVTWAP